MPDLPKLPDEAVEEAMAAYDRTGPLSLGHRHKMQAALKESHPAIYAADREAVLGEVRERVLALRRYASRSFASRVDLGDVLTALSPDTEEGE